MPRAIVEGRRPGFYSFRVRMVDFDGMGLAPIAEVAGLVEPELRDILASGRNFKVKWSLKWETETTDDGGYQAGVIGMTFVPIDVAVHRQSGGSTRLSLAPALRSLREQAHERIENAKLRNSRVRFVRILEVVMDVAPMGNPRGLQPRQRAIALGGTHKTLPKALVNKRCTLNILSLIHI